MNGVHLPDTSYYILDLVVQYGSTDHLSNALGCVAERALALASRWGGSATLQFRSFARGCRV